MASAEYLAEMVKLQGTKPLIKVEHIAIDTTVTDISAYYDSGASLTKEKERAPDQIQAGDFDVVLFNHDDYFSEYKASSLFYSTQYHLSKIRLSAGFILPDGTSEYVVMAVGYIDQIIAHESESKVTLRCRDVMYFILRYRRRFMKPSAICWVRAA